MLAMDEWMKKREGGESIRPPVFSTICAHCSEGISMLPMVDVGELKL